jgi:hypothetical protein
MDGEDRLIEHVAGFELSMFKRIACVVGALPLARL